MMPPETPESAESEFSGRVANAESLLILIATAVIAAAVLQADPLQSANDRSRWATVWSLVERGTYQIDEIDSHAKWSTIDKVRFRANEKEPWHFYSSKPPLLSTLVAGLYGVERWTLGYGLFNHTAPVSRLLLLIVNVLPFFLMLRSLSRCLMLLDAALPVRLFVIAAAGFGSMLNPYLTTLNNHTPAAACAMFAITAAVSILRRREYKPEASARDLPKKNGPATRSLADASGLSPLASTPQNPSLTLRVSWGTRTDFAMLGFFVALTCCFELPAALMGVLAFGLAVFVNRRQAIRNFLTAAAIPLAAFFITNWLVTGGIKPFYASYGSPTYVYEHNGIPSYWSNPRDLDANTESLPTYLFHCVLGHHGLLSLTPVLLISVLGWGLALRRDQSSVRRWLTMTGAAMTLITLSFYLTRTENYNYGGNSVGLRWMLWLSPFWWIAMVPVLKLVSRRMTRAAAALLLLVSIVSASWSLDRPWRSSWLYEQMETAGWIHYRTLPKPFNPPRSSVFSSMPRRPGTSMTWISSERDSLTVTVADEQPDETWLQLVARLKVRGQPDLFDASFGLNLQLWNSQGVVSTKGTRGIDRHLSLEALFSGTPESHFSGIPVIASLTPSRLLQFNSAGTSWIPSKSDAKKAWKVERGAARVLIDAHPVFGKCWHRCDVMYCDQLPFGVLQWKTTVTSEATGEILSTKTWIAEGH